MSTLRIGSRSVEVKNLDKVLFPDDGVTKGEVIDYYRQVAEVMLPHLRDRPLVLHRFPDGIATEGFFQQERPDHFPDWLPGVAMPRADGSGQVEHVVCEDEAGLAYLANQGVITLHGWLSRQDRPDHPDRLVFDLDPSRDDFAAVRDAARQVAELLRQVGLKPYVMTTGSRGLHVLVPLDRRADFDEARALARDLARHLAEQHPDELTVEQRKNQRGRRIYLDVMRNAYGQSAVLPYSLRARAGAPAATPLDWDELGRSELTPQRYGLANLARRLARKADPWADLERHWGSVADARDRFRDQTGDGG